MSHETELESPEAAVGAVQATGSCLCGAVSYEISAPLRDVVECHCAMCRKTHGHIGAYTAVPRTALHLLKAHGLKWYRSSDIARRGFCCQCGGTLFWDAADRDYIAIAAGTLDAPTGLKTTLQIHVADAGDYYTIDHSLPQRA